MRVPQAKGKPPTGWQTMWLIAGPKLPQSEIRARENIILAPLTPEGVKWLSGDVPVLNLEASATEWVAHYPPRDVVKSRYRLQIDVYEEDERKATELASYAANRLITSLSLVVPGGRYHAELRKARRIGEDSEYSAWSQAASVFYMRPPDLLTKTDIDRALWIYDLTEADETAKNAYIHLLTAWQLQDTPGSRPLARSVLQHYVLCMEAIVKSVMSRIKNDMRDRIKLEESKFIAEFAESFIKRVRKADAIREASNRLREIGFLNMLPSIDAVAPLLGVSDDDRDAAKDLYRFRSRNISHPGAAREEEIEHWLRQGPTVDVPCRADAIARAFLFSYCSYLSNQASVSKRR